MSKVIRDCIGFALLHSVIGPENSCHSLNQSDAKLKPFTTCPSAFFRALASLVVYTWSSHWLLKFFPFFWLVVVITYVSVLVSRFSIKKRSMDFNFLRVKKVKENRQTSRATKKEFPRSHNPNRLFIFDWQSSKSCSLHVMLTWRRDGWSPRKPIWKTRTLG